MSGWSVCSPRGSAETLWLPDYSGADCRWWLGESTRWPPTTPSPGLSGFWRDLPREGQLLLSIVVIQFLGTGLVLPFHVVYLHEVRGFPLSDVGLLLGLPPLMGLLVVGPGGSAIDRIGARRVQLGVLSLLVVGDVVLAFATTRPVAALALVINGVAFGMIVAGLAEPDRDGDPPAAAPALLRRQLHPAQPRHRHRRHHRRLLRRRRRPRDLPGDLPRRRRVATSPRCCSCSARCGTSPAGSRSSTTTTPPRWATSRCCAARRWPR